MFFELSEKLEQVEKASRKEFKKLDERYEEYRQTLKLIDIRILEIAEKQIDPYKNRLIVTARAYAGGSLSCNIFTGLEIETEGGLEFTAILPEDPVSAMIRDNLERKGLLRLTV